MPPHPPRALHRALIIVTFLTVAGAPRVAAAAADPTLGASVGTAVFMYDRAPVAVDPHLTVVGASVPATMRVAISAGLASGDTLACDTTGIAGASATYDAGAGVLSLGGAASLADWRTLLRRVTFATSDYLGGPRTIVFSVGSLVPSPDGRFYEYVPGAITWSGALAGAAAHAYAGVGGYLATPTSPDENEFLRLGFTGIAWIGASDDVGAIDAATGAATYPDQASSEGHWYWVAGPQSGTPLSDGDGAPTAVGGAYINWSPGEPNNDSGIEHYGAIALGVGDDGRWNDLPDANGSVTGYLVGYGGLAAGDAVGLSASVTVSVGIDLLPVAANQTLAANEDSDVVVTVSASDPDGDTLTYTASPPIHGGHLYQCVGGARGSAITAIDTPISDGAHRVVFAPAADATGANADLFYFKADDGIVQGLAWVAFDIAAVDDPPRWLLHGGAFAGGDHQAGTAGAQIDLGSATFQVADVDAGSAAIQVLLGVDHGVLGIDTAGLDVAFAADAEGGPVGAGGHGPTLCFRGPLAAVNTALDTLTLASEPGFAGAAHLSLTVDDLGSTGSGGPRSAAAQYRVDLAAMASSPPAHADHGSWLDHHAGCGAGGGLAVAAIAGLMASAAGRSRRHPPG